jgi:hypothetical protein
MSRLTIEITEQQHQNIKALAALQGQSIKEYAMQRLFSYTNGEEQASQESKLAKLRAHLAVGEAAADRGEFSTATAEDIIREGTQRYNARKI